MIVGQIWWMAEERNEDSYVFEKKEIVGKPTV